MIQQLLRMAHQHPETRKHLIPLLRALRAAEEKKTPPKKAPLKSWQDFLDAKYDGGHRQVPNPNPKTRDKFPKVTLWTAIEYEQGGTKPIFDKVLAEFQAWKKQKSTPAAPAAPPALPTEKKDWRKLDPPELSKEEKEKWEKEQRA